MNLVPIDSGTTAPTTDTVAPESGESLGFASIMTGLLAGDSQIAPVIDLPQPPTEMPIEPESDLPQPPIETPIGSENDLGEPGVILEMVGTPPNGMTYLRSVPTHTPPPADGSADIDVTSPMLELVTGDSEPIREIPAAADQVLTPGSPTPLAGPRVQEPDKSAPELPGPNDPTQAVAQSITVPAPQSQSRPDSVADAPDLAVTPPTAAAESEAKVMEPARQTEQLPTAPVQRPSRPVESAAGPLITQMSPGGAASISDVHTPNRATIRETTSVSSETPVDSDLDTGLSARSLDPTRPTVVTARQPITVGIARRVEEAIAALATKPDPKIVTLQLDELDGVRLTVALRPDGVHLSSTGDPRLTFDIERALASRGFDLSSEGRRQQNRETPEEPGATEWRPHSATRRRTTDPNAIKL